MTASPSDKGEGSTVRVTTWIVGSGASQHMVPRKSVYARDVYAASKPIKLATANGVVCSYDRVFVIIPALKTCVEAVVLDSTPAALSLGRLVQYGFKLSWSESVKVVFVSPKGEYIPPHYVS